MCVGWGGGREGGGELVVIARVVGEGAAHPLTHWAMASGQWRRGERGSGVVEGFFPALRLVVMCGGRGVGGAGSQSKCEGDKNTPLRLYNFK